ncbi:MAG: response regulator [Campylobacterales bacterium]|nr:response regulator [Campylobacterales bacterium]
MKALVLDDVPLMRKVIASKLTKLGVEKIIETGDPKKAILDFNNESGIKLIISDYRMPSMNGSEFFQKIYKIPNSKNIKSVLTSGIEDLQFIQTADGLSIDYYLSKTDLMDKLEEIVTEARDYIPKSQDDLMMNLKDFKQLVEKQSPKIEVDQNILLLGFGEKKILIDLPEQLNISVSKG